MGKHNTAETTCVFRSHYNVTHVGTHHGLIAAGVLRADDRVPKGPNGSVRWRERDGSSVAVSMKSDRRLCVSRWAPDRAGSIYAANRRAWQLYNARSDPAFQRLMIGMLTPRATKKLRAEVAELYRPGTPKGAA